MLNINMKSSSNKNSFENINTTSTVSKRILETFYYHWAGPKL